MGGINFDGEFDNNFDSDALLFEKKYRKANKDFYQVPLYPII